MSLLKGQIVEPEKRLRIESLRFADLLQQDAERRDDHFIRLRRNGLPPPRDLPKKEVEIPAEELHRRRLEQIEREAFQKAFTAGEEAGLAMGEQKKQEEIARLLPRFDAIFKQLNRLPARIFAASEQFMVETCLLLLQEIFKHELTVNKASLAARVKKILEQLSHRDRMEIHLHPEDGGYLRGLPEFSQLVILDDGAVERGTVRLESEFGGVEDNLGLQLREAEQSLREYLNGRLEEIGKGRFTLPPPGEDPWAALGSGDAELASEPAPVAQAAPGVEEPPAPEEALPQPERVVLDALDLSELEEGGSERGMAAEQAHDFLDPAVAMGDDEIRPAPDDAQEAAWLAELLEGAGTAKPASPAVPPSRPASAPLPQDAFESEQTAGVGLPLDGALEGGLEGYDLSGLGEETDLADLEFSAAPVGEVERPAPLSEPAPDDEEEAAWVDGILSSATLSEVGVEDPTAGLEGYDLSALSSESDLAAMEFSAAPVGEVERPAPLSEPAPDDEEEAAWIQGILGGASTREVVPESRQERRSVSSRGVTTDEEDELAPGTILDAQTVSHVPAVSGMGLSQAELDALLAEPDDVISDDELAAFLAQAAPKGRRRPLSGSPLGGDSPLGRKR